MALNETDLFIFLGNLPFCKLELISSSVSSVKIVSALLIKIVDQKSCLIDSTDFPVKFSKERRPFNKLK